MGSIMRSALVFALLVLPLTVAGQQSIADRMGVRHWSGEGVSPQP